MMASMLTHTPVTSFMDMTIRQFYRMLQVICDVMEKRRNGGE